MNKNNNDNYGQLGEMLEQMPIILEVARQKSRWNKTRYDSLIEEGFTDKQALEITKNERTPFDR